MGTGMENYIPEFREREWEWKIAFPTFGNENEKIIPKLWEREWEAGILGNGREREFPLTPALDVLQVVQEMINAVLPIIKTFGRCGNNQKGP